MVVKSLKQSSGNDLIYIALFILGFLFFVFRSFESDLGDKIFITEGDITVITFNNNNCSAWYNFNGQNIECFIQGIKLMDYYNNI